MRLLKLDTVYQGWTTLYLATLVDESGTEVRREIEHHGRSAAVLPYDPARRVAMMIRLPRAPVIWQGGPDELMEAPAGMLDKDDPPTAARREALEETGLSLGALEPIGSVWPMPGISSEKMDLFLAPYSAADRRAAGGGVADEHEAITVMEVPLAELWAMAEAGGIEDLKTLALLQALRIRRPELF